MRPPRPRACSEKIPTAADMSPLAILLVSLMHPPAPATAPISVPNGPSSVSHAPVAVVVEAEWKASESDNIAGLTDLKKLSNPAVVDYDALLAATSEMKEIERERIDPESTKGRSLRQQAADRVTKAADLIRKEKRHCSVWKQISHKDGRKIPDITQAVKDKLDSV